MAQDGTAGTGRAAKLLDNGTEIVALRNAGHTMQKVAEAMQVSESKLRRAACDVQAAFYCIDCYYFKK